MTDVSLRDLERRARAEPGDVALQSVYRAACCRADQHDYRCDRLCAWCNRQLPGHKLWDALKLGNGEGAVGYLLGRRVGRADGTFKGLPRRSRSQRGLDVSVHMPQHVLCGRSYNENWKIHRLDVPDSFGGPYYRTERWPLTRNFAAQCDRITWYPAEHHEHPYSAENPTPHFFMSCEGYREGDMRRNETDLPYMAVSCAKLTEEQLAINAKYAARRAAEEREAQERREWNELDRLTDPLARPRWWSGQ